MSSPSLPRGIALCALLFAAGCQLFPEPAPAPNVYSVPLSAGPPIVPTAQAHRLRLRTLRAAAHLDEDIAWRDGLRVGSRAGQRWSERPATVLEYSLIAQLFSDGRLTRTEALDAPLIDVGLLAFEEDVSVNPTTAVISIRAHVLDEKRSEILDLPLTVTEPIEATGDQTEALARALGKGLDTLCAQLREQVVKSLGG